MRRSHCAINMWACARRRVGRCAQRTSHSTRPGEALGATQHPFEMNDTIFLVGLSGHGRWSRAGQGEQECSLALGWSNGLSERRLSAACPNRSLFDTPAGVSRSEPAEGSARTRTGMSVSRNMRSSIRNKAIRAERLEPTLEELKPNQRCHPGAGRDPLLKNTQTNAERPVHAQMNLGLHRDDGARYYSGMAGMARVPHALTEPSMMRSPKKFPFALTLRQAQDGVRLPAYRRVCLQASYAGQAEVSNPRATRARGFDTSARMELAKQRRVLILSRAVPKHPAPAESSPQNAQPCGAAR